MNDFGATQYFLVSVRDSPFLLMSHRFTLLYLLPSGLLWPRSSISRVKSERLSGVVTERLEHTI